MSGAKKTAVVMEGREDLARLYKEALEAGGFEVFSSPDGKTGIDRVLAVRPDLVVVTDHTSVMHGYDACRYLRQRGDLDGMKILMLSEGNGFKDKACAARAGADACLDRSADLDVLVLLARGLAGFPPEAAGARAA